MTHSSLKGADRVWAHRNRMLQENGYYTSDELMDQADSIGFTIYDPFVRIKRSTKICTGVLIGEGCAVDGDNVVLGPETHLSNAVIRGSKVVLGSRNLISGDIEVSNLIFGDDNVIAGISGENSGTVQIGNSNRIGRICIKNRVDGTITIGNENELHDRLNLNVPFEQGAIYIGYRNSLGRDGGGVISSSYRFGRGWGGPVVIGSLVESTRGAEILGFSVLGWPLVLLEELGYPEEMLSNLFATCGLGNIEVWISNLLANGSSRLSEYTESMQPVSLFGVVKVKRCCLVGKVKIKDDTRIQCSYARDILIPERCNITYSQVIPSSHVLTLPSQDAILECRIVRKAADMEVLPSVSQVDEYPKEDNEYYQDWSWDQSEGR